MLQNVGLADSHTHSRCSFDGSEPVRALGEAAERKGLRCLTVTDHYDCNCFDLPILLGTALASSQETAECAQAMQGRLTVLFGAELGQPLQAPAAAEAVVTRDTFTSGNSASPARTSSRKTSSAAVRPSAG